MKKNPLSAPILASILFGAAIPAVAELPSLTKEPWGYSFVGIGGRAFDFRVDDYGRASILPLNKAGKRLGQDQSIPVLLQIEEVLPNGKTVVQKIDIDSLETKDKPLSKNGTVKYTGKTLVPIPKETPDAEEIPGATFEITIEVARGSILLGGRIVDPGKGYKNPLRFSVLATVPDVYKNVKDKEDKVHKKKIEDDAVEVRWADGKKLKQAAHEGVDAQAEALNGTGILQMQVELGVWEEHVIEFAASPGTKLVLSKVGSNPLAMGFNVEWVSDPEGKGRFAVSGK